MSPRTSALAAVLALCVPLWPEQAAGQADDAESGVVKIETERPNEPGEKGSGFVVRLERGRAYVITAAHVVEGATSIKVYFASQRLRHLTGRTVGRIEAGNPQGLALLSVDGAIPAGVAALPLAADSALPKGRRFFTIGHTVTGDWGLVEGMISNIDGREITIQAPVSEGNSGGPLLVDGAVAGMVFARAGQSFGRAIDSGQIVAFLKGKGVEPGTAGSSVSPAPVARGAQTQAPERLPAAAPAARTVLIPGPKPLYAGYKTGDVFQECTDCPQMVAIVPDGPFTIGSPRDDTSHDSDEDQFGPINFARPYAIGRYEVTRGQFANSGTEAVYPSGRDGDVVQPRDATGDCKDALNWGDRHSSWRKPGFEQTADHPVVCVNWKDARNYISWLNARPGVAKDSPYRLPTEAEWEHAARAGTKSPYYWGDSESCEYANWFGCGSKATIKVGSLKPNGFGLYDMSGNVSEWVQDCYAKHFSSDIQSGAAYESFFFCGERVQRGGSWFGVLVDVRSAGRIGVEASERLSFAGFRLGRTLPER